MPPQPVQPPPVVAEPPARSRRWLWLAIGGGVAFVLLVAGVVGWFVVAEPFDDRTRVTLAAAMPDGSPPTEAALAQAADVLAGRLETAGFTDPEVRVDGDQLAVSYRDEYSEQRLRPLIGIGDLQFRKVIESTEDQSGCGQPGSPPAEQPVVSCDDTWRYELAPAALTDRDVATAAATLDPMAGSWVVTVEFTADGQTRWTDLTREAAENAGGECRTVGGFGACQIAIMIDGQVISAPEVTQVIVGPAQIQHEFTADDAKLLAAQLGHGSQPLVLEIESVTV
ncbi:MAG TPA: hypothetical protein VIL37_10155 [Natronosporangium sp.]